MDRFEEEVSQRKQIETVRQKTDSIIGGCCKQ